MEKSIECHLGCKKRVSKMHYILHLKDHHQLHFSEGPGTLLTLRSSPSEDFETGKPYKLHAVGVIATFENFFLVLGVETLERFRVFSILLDEIGSQEEGRTEGAFFCSFHFHWQPFSGPTHNNATIGEAINQGGLTPVVLNLKKGENGPKGKRENLETHDTWVSKVLDLGVPVEECRIGGRGVFTIVKSEATRDLDLVQIHATISQETMEDYYQVQEPKELFTDDDDEAIEKLPDDDEEVVDDDDDGSIDSDDNEDEEGHEAMLVDMFAAERPSFDAHTLQLLYKASASKGKQENVFVAPSLYFQGSFFS